MTTIDLIAEIAKRNRITKVEAGKCYDYVIDIIIDLILEGNEISLAKFGKFQLITKKERVIKNLVNKKNGKQIPLPKKIIPAYKIVAFKPYSEMKRLLKQLKT